MQNCQSELREIVLCDNPDVPHMVEKLPNGMDLAFRHTIYASDYAKKNAVEHILASLVGTDEKECIVHFFDDFVGNAFDVGTLSNVHSYWCWDSFSEEVSGGMGVINTFSSDFPYQEDTKRMLLSGLGMTEEEFLRRRSWYEKFEKDNNISKPPAGLQVEKPVVKKKDMSAFAGLALGINRSKPLQVLNHTRHLRFLTSSEALPGLHVTKHICLIHKARKLIKKST